MPTFGQTPEDRKRKGKQVELRHLVVPTLTCSQESGDSPSLPTGRDTEPLDSARLTNGASESSDDTGQMSLFGETCERLTLSLFPTPRAMMASGWRKPGAPGYRSNIEESTCYQQATRASHSHSPGSDWARRMTATYGRKFADYWLSSDPPDSWVRTLLVTSVWGSTTCYLTWKKSATPQGRLLFRLVPSTPRTDGIGSGYWGTPTSRDWKDGSSVANVPENGFLGRQVVNRQWPTPRVGGFDAGAHRGNPDSLHSAVKLWPTPRASENEMRTTKPAPSQIAGTHGKGLSAEVGQSNGLKLNSAWVSRMMGYPDSWLTLDGEVTP